jgi:transcriptional regulator with XRE-family HTH domain
MKPEPTGRQNGAAMRALREKDRRTVIEVACYAGIGEQSLRNIENGSRPASDEVIALIADILYVPVEAVTRSGTADGIAPLSPAMRERARARVAERERTLAAA